MGQEFLLYLIISLANLCGVLYIRLKYEYSSSLPPSLCL